MKTCPKCKKNLEFSKFPRDKTRKNGIFIYCRICNVKRRNLYKKLHPEKEKEWEKNQQIKKREFIWGYFKSHPCVDCGETDKRVLQFDHLRDKITAVSCLVNRGSLRQIQEEIKKCEVRCANCHMRKTIVQFNWYSYMPPSPIGKAFD